MKFRPGLPSDADSLAVAMGEASSWHPPSDVEQRERERLRARLADSEVWCRIAEEDSGPFYEREGWRETGAHRYAESDKSLELVEYRLALSG
jgi:hypothetical protein